MTKDTAAPSFSTKTNLVEIIGPPGVGKSTLYLATCKQWQKNLNWIHEKELYTPEQPPLRHFAKWAEYHLRRLAGKSLIRSFRNESGVEFSQQNPELAEFIWNHLGKFYSGKEEAALRYRAAYFLFLNFCRYQGLLTEPSHRHILIEEGFLQKSFLVHQDENYLSDLLDEYLSLVPLPAAVVSITSPDEGLILKRLTQRGKIIASHQGKGEQEILEDLRKWNLLNRLISQKLTLKNIPVWTLDGEKKLGQKVDELKKILSSLN
jgi:hypothetical protein